MSSDVILTVSGPGPAADHMGTECAILSVLADHSAILLESGHFRDPVHGRMVMRLVCRVPDKTALKQALTARTAALGLTCGVHDRKDRPRVVILVSRFGHCLKDLAARAAERAIAMDIAAVLSNQPDLGDWAGRAGLPFHYLPVDAANRSAQEGAVLDLVMAARAELVILARYMQVLSPALLARLPCPVINIHHSLLPAFEGAKPYSQAYARGVKMIGATAHYVTPVLDGGPIIEQAALPAGHADSLADMIAKGRDLECMVLARAVRQHLERRVFIDGSRTIILQKA